jgi:putative heme degradation protein
MTETSSLRSLVAADAAAVLARLPRMGAVMLTARHGGATHERIGPVDEVTRDGGVIVCRGACHDARIGVAAIASVIVDRSGRMRDTALPRLDFHDADGLVIFSVIGMAGLEPFDAGAGDLALGEPLPAEPRPTPERTEVAADDPGIGPFAAAAANGGTVTIEMVRPGLIQAWQGTVEAVKPSMGFINVMRPDFHLHLKGAAVASWRKEAAGDETVLAAQNLAGEAFGLRVRGAISALAAFSA